MGENERPIRPLNFRNKLFGGLGLIHPKIKAKAFLIKNIYFDFLQYNGNIADGWMANNLYGFSKDFVRVYNEGLAMAPVWEIYNFLLHDMVSCNGSLIPSRREKKSQNVKGVYNGMVVTLETFLGQEIEFNHLIHFAFNH